MRNDRFMPKGEKPEKEKPNVKALIKSIFWFVVTVGVFILRVWYIDHRKDEKNAITFMAVIVVIGLVFLIKNIIALLPKSFKEAIKEKASQSFKKIIYRITGMNKLLKKAIGGSKEDLSGRVRLSEERSFIFDRENRRRKAMKKEPPPKWRDMKDNPKKITFLFPRFISRLSKKGYRYSIFKTPYENGDDFRLSREQGGEMFRLYTDAKYSGGRAITTDEDVEYAKVCADFKE